MEVRYSTLEIEIRKRIIAVCLLIRELGPKEVGLRQGHRGANCGIWQGDWLS